MKRTILALLIILIVGIALAQNEPTPPPDVPDWKWQGWIETMEQCEAGLLPELLCIVTEDMYFYLGVPSPEPAQPQPTPEPPPYSEPMPEQEIIEINEVYADEFWSWLPE